MHINDILKVAVERKASDIHIKVGAHPVLRIDGRLQVLFEDQCQDYSPVQLLFPSRPYRTFKEELFARAVTARLAQEQLGEPAPAPAPE